MLRLEPVHHPPADLGDVCFASRGVSPSMIGTAVSALRFFFKVTLDRPG
jgi:hypothetical protein